MDKIQNPLDNMSYTNKDFQSIYPELLDMVKDLTHKWDPTISNESDPGVVLLKANAVLADKNNYNIDKNVLECFPLSVTQRQNAYQLFDQLGYSMKQYVAAGSKRGIEEILIDGEVTRATVFTGDVIGIGWAGEIETIPGDVVTYTIPQFSMVSDEDNNIIYTLLNEQNVDNSTNEPKKFLALQGVITEYTINNNPKITYANLDSNNRIYFNDINIAENGIFIANYTSGGQSQDYFSWVKVDNIEVQPIGKNQKYYKFGLSQDLASYYIEFPENADELIGEGISIKYIKTDGENGNIPARTITQGYQIGDVSEALDTDSTISFNDNFLVSNYSAIENGSDPESIDSAYRNFKRTVGTFDTLVTLRDYTNAALLTGEASNGFVCDRTNDPEDTYKVMTSLNALDIAKTYIETDQQNNPLLTAFDLKFYLLKNPSGKIDTESKYRETFDMFTSNGELYPIEQLIEENKCIQHDYKYIDQSTGICYFKNKYAVKCKIIPQYSITKLQRDDIESKVKKALYERFNARNVDFGVEISYEDVYDTIINADQRIKTIFLDDIDYNTTVCGYNGVMVEGPLTQDVSDINNTATEVYAKSVLAGKTQLLEPDRAFSFAVDQNGTLISDIDRIETFADGHTTPVSGSSTSVKYTLKDNEIFQAYAPNYTVKANYGAYVRYWCDFAESGGVTNTIPAGTTYKLKTGEKITLKWKNSDDDASPQTKSYEAGSIVKPSITLTKSSYAETSDYSAWNSLSSSGQIEILEKNEQTIETTTSVWWITDTKSSDGSSYVLFDAGVADRMLSENEYLFYTYSETELGMLGSGTKLHRASAGSTVVCKAGLSTDEVLTYGVKALDGYWTNFTESVTATDEQIVSAGYGNEITITVPSGSTPPATLDKTEVQLESFIIKDSGTDDVYNSSVLMTDDTWSARLLLSFDTIGGKSQELVGTQAVEFSDQNDTLLDRITDKTIYTSAPISLLGDTKATVSYVVDGDTEYVDAYAVSSITTPTPSNGTATKQSDGTFKCTVDANETSTLTFSSISLPGTENFLLPISIPSSLQSISVTYNGSSPSSTIDGRNTTTQQGGIGGNLYFVIPGGTTSVTVTATNNEASAVSFTIMNMFRYTMDGALSNVLSKVEQLDQAAGYLYNYTYIVDSDVEIENPLDPISFFDPNHIYNDNTIGMIDSISLTITNVR